MANQMLWSDIDHAEKCLVSAMYEEAAEVAKSTLRILVREAWNEANRSLSAQSEPLGQSDEREEVVSMIEAAGMVLVQAVNEMERPCNIFCDLISIFNGVDKVPYSFVLTGTCLQLSMGFHPSSQTAIEEYLSGWRPPEGGSDGLMVKVVQSPVDQNLNETSSIVNGSKGVACTVYLSRTNYLQLSEIYAIEVLAKLQNNSVAAHLWIQNSNISEEDKQATLQRLQLVSQSQRPSPSSSTSQGTERSPGVISRPLERAWKETGGAGSFEQESNTNMESSQPIGAQLPPKASDESKSRVRKGSGVWRFTFVRTVMRLLELVMIRVSVTSGSTWVATQRKLPRRKLLLTGALSSIIVYAVIRKRLLLRRRLMEMGNLASVCFSDLWRLAFTVHLNPLAAV